MPYLKFSRDKRGYEHFFIVQPGKRQGDARATRVLYWFRTPPNVRIGREPFDAAARRTLERQYPNVRFDWQALLSTPIPPPAEPEPWRERRRAERMARQSAAADAAEEPSAEPLPRAAAGADSTAAEGPAAEPAPADTSSDTVASVGVDAADAANAAGDPTRRKRRRRRRRRGGGGATPPPAGEL